MRRAPPADVSKVKFGTVFADHMLSSDWAAAAGGWTAPTIAPLEPLRLHPASCALHYAVQCFEGLKAYRGARGEVRLFRPELNARRLANSLKRLELPAIPENEFVDLIKHLVKVDERWVPSAEGSSLYIRPAVIGNSEFLGVAPAEAAKFFVISCPVGAYYATGFKPVSLLAETQFVRAWPGGTGANKVGANYAVGLGPQAEAQRKGFNQVLWLENDELTEVGTMNVFVVFKNPKTNEITEVVTPPLTSGVILPGVTRDSILALCREWYGPDRVKERRVTMTEVRDAAARGALAEAFGAGTAAVVSPIASISYKNIAIRVPLDAPGGAAGLVAARAHKELLDIQYGRREHAWSVLVVP